MQSNRLLLVPKLSFLETVDDSIEVVGNAVTADSIDMSFEWAAQTAVDAFYTPFSSLSTTVKHCKGQVYRDIIDIIGVLWISQSSRTALSATILAILLLTPL